MNILIALSQLEVTGAEVYGVTLANELIERGNNVWKIYRCSIHKNRI